MMYTSDKFKMIKWFTQYNMPQAVINSCAGCIANNGNKVPEEGFSLVKF